ncbi:putative non-specific serine/threonine protein kinase [Helianthus annuus]|uniref:Non-specific serine/threonine protein kinase n=1 Tax=Helianthus annuus TaxID=4232 RepID=A0A251SKW1_HELAN|nr:putative non-specific serine/threonine protein kinase [Helianthus annuus]KAJ0465594.1 putative non-specific serine/threonine protein kinase [Helianthus annuus]KAJ0470459.1 putative non-specific serine/threonine protein kinase [Helianthus annuus]KAJ0487187.1 putative non-specific serine/threonine protein kinase [Helianthus annuus]KAJ0661302.1 putative non-specific serine/threonine protein kinase [Helianthus annuus]
MRNMDRRAALMKDCAAFLGPYPFNNITGDIIWQSFDHPGNTWLPGMKIGVDLVTGIQRNLTSWKDSHDPLPGSYTVSMDINGYPQLYINNMNGEKSLQQRVGSANGLGFTGMHGLMQINFSEFKFVYEKKKEMYIMFNLLNSLYFTKMILNYEGQFRQLVWITSNQSSERCMASFEDECKSYNLCGTYGNCNISTYPVCTCLEGFEPKVPEEWSVNNWSNGCKHKIPMNSETGHKFSKLSNAKFPDSRNVWYNSTMSRVSFNKGRGKKGDVNRRKPCSRDFFKDGRGGERREKGTIFVVSLSSQIGEIRREYPVNY